jgi:ribosome recycling factor
MEKELIDDAKERMRHAVAIVGDRLSTVRTGTANASALNSVQVEAYGSKMKLQELAMVSAPEPRLLVVSPYDKSLTKAIEKAILAANLGMTPQSDGGLVRIPVPALTEETRKEIVKGVKKIVEEGKVAVRNIRREVNERLKKMEKAGEISEDDEKRAEHEVQKRTDEFSEQIDKMGHAKEAEVMKV